MTPILWKYYKAKDGLYPIKLKSRTVVDGKIKVIYKDTRIRVRRNQFSGGWIKDHPDMRELNDKIRAMTNQTVAQKTFLEYFEDFANRPHGYYHKRKLAGVYRMLQEKNPKLTIDYLMRMERDLSEEGKHPNYIASIFKCMRTVVGIMVKAGAIEYHKNPFLHFKIKTVKTEKDRLTYEQLLTLQGVKLDKLRGLARDMYIVSFYQGGIRFGDLCRLTKSNIQKDRLFYLMNKTSQERNLILNPVAERILKSYDYQFPLNIDWKQEEKSINAKNALMNKHLKKACVFAGIPPVTFHTSRHSIADYAVKKKLTSKQIQGLLGHSKLTTTETYLKNFYMEETDSGLRELFS